jgi:ATP-binding cassette, subfamily B (MDR/TAP), member 1
MRIYDSQDGVVMLDEGDMRFLDEEWMKGYVAGVDQQGASGVVILDGKTLFENIAIGSRLMEGEVRRETVEDACRAALMHEFVRDLPLGYETILGGGVGVGLSGGQKQRLSIARAKLRNPTVLILGKTYFCSKFLHQLIIYKSDGLRVSPVVELVREANERTDVVLTAVNNLNGIMVFSFVVGQCTNNLHSFAYGRSTLSL